MTEPEPGPPHLNATTVAELDAGVLDPSRTTAVVTHLSSCRRCQGLRRELADVSALLRAEPSPGMPADVATRLDAALQRAAQARAADEDENRVVPLTSRRLRWLAPLAAAATVVVAVAVGSQVLQPQGTDDSAATSEQKAPAGGIAADEGSPESALGSRRRPLSLSTESFGSDVVRKLYSTADGTATLRRDGAAPPFREELHNCLPAAELTYAGRVHPVLLDGRPALLFLSGSRTNRLALAVSCDSGSPVVEARARLDLD